MLIYIFKIHSLFFGRPSLIQNKFVKKRTIRFLSDLHLRNQQKILQWNQPSNLPDPPTQINLPWLWDHIGETCQRCHTNIPTSPQNVKKDHHSTKLSVEIHGFEKWLLKSPTDIGKHTLWKSLTNINTHTHHTMLHNLLYCHSM